MIIWNSYRVLNSEEIAQLEEDIQTKLPEDYKSFASTKGLYESESDLEDNEVGIECFSEFLFSGNRVEIKKYFYEFQ
jgi:hypothetical protein